MPRRAWLAVLCLLLIPPASARAADDCPAGAQCGQITVPLDHSGLTPGTLPLSYARVPATAPGTGTLVILSGGPGEAAIPLEPLLAPVLKGLPGYDVVYVDQRGIGGSGGVDCDILHAHDLVAACAHALGAAAPFMTTAQTAEDLESLRTALGVDRFTLLGVSYGTLVAREYARRHPERTAAVVLDSAVGAHWLDGLDRPRIDVLQRVLREVCGGCDVRDPGAALMAAGRRVRHGGIPVRVRLTRDGAVGQDHVVAVDLFEVVSESDEAPFLRARLPGAIAAVAAGDGAPLEHLRRVPEHALSSFSAGEAYNEARHLATACLERRFPWATDSPPAGRATALRAAVARLGEGAFAPFGSDAVLAFSEADLCERWPAMPAPAATAAAEPDLPVLILSGREDLRAPLEDARAIAAGYPHATLVAVPGVGHSVLVNEGGTCARRAMEAFLARRPVAGCDRARATRSRPPAEPVVPVRLAEGKARAAVALTLAGLLRDLKMGATVAPWEPGLRGGVYRVRHGRILLDHVAWVHGVRLTGTLLGRRERIRITGRVHGRLAGHGNRLSGTLAGRRVTMRMR